MKIALAFFGQPRGIDNDMIIEQWLRILRDSSETCTFDVYAHFWDNQSNTKISDTYEEFVKETQVDANTHFDKFIKAFRPKQLHIEPSNVLDKLSSLYFSNNEYVNARVDPAIPSTGRATIGQWYSTERVLDQVINSGVEYDIVIRIRPDIIFEQTESHHRFFEFSLINHFKACAVGNRCIGVPSIEIKSGTPILNDWWTVMYGGFVEEFKTNLTKNISSQINAIFTTLDTPNSIQENALHRHCIKLDINAVSTKAEARIYRKEEGTWVWPNYLVDSK